MNVNETVNDFLRDAQYRIAELSTQVNTHNTNIERLSDIDDIKDIRSQLIMFMDVVYEGYTAIYDGSNYLGYWTDLQIVEECEYLRNISGMNAMPYLSFSANEISFANFFSWPLTIIFICSLYILIICMIVSIFIE